MTTITFPTDDALADFHCMCEGMEEIARDDGETQRADLLVALIEATGDAAPGVPRALSKRLVPVARIVLENCDDGDEPAGIVITD